jgi:hypothetical protein
MAASTETPGQHDIRPSPNEHPVEKALSFLEQPHASDFRRTLARWQRLVVICSHNTNGEAKRQC